jgi:hypothetical protein
VNSLVVPDDSLRLTYIQATWLAHFDVSQFGPGDTDAIYLIGGPGFSFKVHSSYSSPRGTDDAIGEIRNIDFNLIAGVGLHAGDLIVEARYDWGYVSPFQLRDSDSSFKNRSFAFMVGWKL